MRGVKVFVFIEVTPVAYCHQVLKLYLDDKSSFSKKIRSIIKPPNLYNHICYLFVAFDISKIGGALRSLFA